MAEKFYQKHKKLLIAVIVITAFVISFLYIYPCYQYGFLVYKDIYEEGYWSEETARYNGDLAFWACMNWQVNDKPPNKIIDELTDEAKNMVGKIIPGEKIGTV